MARAATKAMEASRPAAAPTLPVPVMEAVPVMAVMPVIEEPVLDMAASTQTPPPLAAVCGQ